MPTSLPNYEYSGEFLISEMKTYSVDVLLLPHVCYYGRDNSYTSHCIERYPGKFAGNRTPGRLSPPLARRQGESWGALQRLVREDGLIGLRLSPIYDRKVVWLNLSSESPDAALGESGRARSRVQYLPRSSSGRPSRGYGRTFSRSEHRHRSPGDDRHRGAATVTASFVVETRAVSQCLRPYLLHNPIEDLVYAVPRCMAVPSPCLRRLRSAPPRLGGNFLSTEL